MTTTETSLSPLQLSDRIQSLDVMRGIVLFGILLMNINGFGLSGAYDDPTVSGGATGWDLITWITTNMFFEGTMRGLFPSYLVWECLSFWIVLKKEEQEWKLPIFILED